VCSEVIDETPPESADELDGEVLATAENFDEQRYLAANPDIATLVRQTPGVTGLWHFQMHGQAEGRKLASKSRAVDEAGGEVLATAENFDEYRYLAGNPDVVALIKQIPGVTALWHFQMHGQAEGRKLGPKVGPVVVASDYYESRAPLPMNSLDLFHGTWSSYIPGFGYGKLGNPFASDVIKWLISTAGELQGRSVLELGPLEAGHTHALCNAGADVTAIESNAGAYLKCLLIKELFNLPAHFRFGDFMPFLAQTTERYDWLLASGVLYHTLEPVTLLDGIARVTDNLMLWTVYYDAAVVESSEELRARFEPEPVMTKFRGRDVAMYRYKYLDALEWSGFSGGPADSAMWLTRETILGILADLGYKVSLGPEASGPGGSSMTLIARR
jgi:hypothetical protein